MFDPIIRPKHYNLGEVECIDALKSALGDDFYAFCRGNAIKYLWRAGSKGKLEEDLRKAIWYIEMELASLGMGEDPRKYKKSGA